MPVQYASIVDEHNATRAAVGVFDISHMGRLAIDGPDAAKFLDAMVTRRVDNMRPGQIRYGLMCNADGGILDDVLVYRYADGTTIFGQAEYGLVVNAGNTPKIVDWLTDRQIEFAARLRDLTSETAMIAVQGPQAMAIAGELTDGDISSLKYYTGRQVNVCGVPTYVSRTGYTGEDGVELIVTADDAEPIWATIIDKCVAFGGRAVGLGARDTLRLEAAMPLYGHELSESIDPVAAGLEFAINADDREFIGRDAILAARRANGGRVRVGLQLEGRRAAREGSTVLAEGKVVGEVTSGTFSPTFGRPIAMAYVDRLVASDGTELAVDIRGKSAPATVVSLPFYHRSR